MEGYVLLIFVLTGGCVGLRSVTLCGYFGLNGLLRCLSIELMACRARWVQGGPVLMLLELCT